MKTMRSWMGAAALMSAVCLAASPAAAKTDKHAVLDTYVRIAHAAYGDALAGAKTLRTAINTFLKAPSKAGLEAARKAWIAARVPYMQTEAYRFGNPIVDEWEGRVNSWPLDEGMIDYVAKSYGTSSKENPLYTANVIANPKIKLGGKVIDAMTITKKLLAEQLHEAGKVEANVATGYHAIEFLLWGQDLNGTGPGAGNRPWTDYSTAKCTNGNCARRAAYLRVATDLLVDDLAWMTAQWAPGGKARERLLKGDANKGIAIMLTGMGSLSYGELAGERMKLGLMLHDPEEEHDCFSDNTHNSHYYDQMGIMNVYFGRYTRTDGSKVGGPSLANLVAETTPMLGKELAARLAATHAAMVTLKKRAEAGEAYDQMIGAKNPAGNAVVEAAVEALKTQTKSIQKVVAALGLKPIAFEGSDSLDEPEKVFK
jgi:putative iron-regulated protein